MKTKYYLSDILKPVVPAQYKSWDIKYDDYTPVNYTAESVLDCPPWADPESVENILFNFDDGWINRKSFLGKYDVIDGYPRNPKGRTGIKSRGYLGKWGPNHAVDTILSRINSSNEPELALITRSDNKKMAFPGGFVDNGETPLQTSIRETMEEIFNFDNFSEKQKAQSWLKRNLPNASIMFQGHVYDDRSTDNSWVETTVFYCLSTHADPIDFPLQYGDDAIAASWVKLSSNIKLWSVYNDLIDEIRKNFNIFNNL